MLQLNRPAFKLRSNFRVLISLPYALNLNTLISNMNLISGWKTLRCLQGLAFLLFGIVMHHIRIKFWFDFITFRTGLIFDRKIVFQLKTYLSERIYLLFDQMTLSYKLLHLLILYLQLVVKLVEMFWLILLGHEILFLHRKKLLQRIILIFWFHNFDFWQIKSFDKTTKWWTIR